MLSIPDMALLGAAALMFFGPEQLPKVARKVGILMRDVQNTSQTFIREMERAADADVDGHGVSRAHLLDDAPSYNGSANGSAYGAYDGGSVASSEAVDIPRDEFLAPPAVNHPAPSSHQYEPPEPDPVRPLSGHQPPP